MPISPNCIDWYLVKYMATIHHSQLTGQRLQAYSAVGKGHGFDCRAGVKFKSGAAFFE
jgi:hypothetical protein